MQTYMLYEHQIGRILIKIQARLYSSHVHVHQRKLVLASYHNLRMQMSASLRVIYITLRRAHCRTP